MRGADATTLEAKIKQHYVVSETAQSNGSAASVSGYPDITSNVDVKNVFFNLDFTDTQVECLNQQDSHPVRNVLNPGSAYLESDVDEQLSIFLNVCVSLGIDLTVVPSTL